MNLKDAKICLDCEEIFVGKACPKCGGGSWQWLQAWLMPIAGKKISLAPARHCQALAGGEIAEAGI